MKITYTDIKKFLNQCVFNPNKLGPLSIIADVGNADYYEIRACEFIKEAKDYVPTIFRGPYDYDDKIIKAIQLLCLAREIRTRENTNESKNNIKKG